MKCTPRIEKTLKEPSFFLSFLFFLSYHSRMASLFYNGRLLFLSSKCQNNGLLLFWFPQLCYQLSLWTNLEANFCLLLKNGQPSSFFFSLPRLFIKEAIKWHQQAAGLVAPSIGRLLLQRGAVGKGQQQVRGKTSWVWLKGLLWVWSLGVGCSWRLAWHERACKCWAGGDRIARLA